MAFVGCRSRRRRLSLTGVALCCAVSLAGCAGRITQGETVGIRWRVDELRTSERTLRPQGYSSEGVVRDYRYVLLLEETRGVGVTFRSIESTQIVGPGFRATPRSQAIEFRLQPRGRLRITLSDAVWSVIPGWYESRPQAVELNPAVRKVLQGADDRGEPVKLIMEFLLNDIPGTTPSPTGPTSRASYETVSESWALRILPVALFGSASSTVTRRGYL